MAYKDNVSKLEEKRATFLDNIKESLIGAAGGIAQVLIGMF
jgi:hypothetical protein